MGVSGGCMYGWGMCAWVEGVCIVWVVDVGWLTGCMGVGRGCLEGCGLREFVCVWIWVAGVCRSGGCVYGLREFVTDLGYGWMLCLWV